MYLYNINNGTKRHEIDDINLLLLVREKIMGVLRRTIFLWVSAVRRPTDGGTGHVYLDDVYLVTALVPSETACLASSPGSNRRTAVWISRLVMVERRL